MSNPSQHHPGARNAPALLARCSDPTRHPRRSQPAPDRVIDPDDLTEPQRAGQACALCHKRAGRFVPFGKLPDGRRVYICADHADPDECLTTASR